MNDLINLPQLEVEIKFYLGQTAQNIIEVGKRLIQAKNLVQHGQWQQWLQNNFQLSYRSAAKFMQCAEQFSNVPTSATLNVSQLTEMLSLPDAEETEKFIAEKAAEGKKVAEMTIKQLRDEIAAYKATIEQKDTEHQQSLFDLQEQLDDLQKKLNDRPTVAPQDYDATKKELVDAKVALARAADDSKQQADKLATARKEIKKLKERLDAKADIAAQRVDNAQMPTLFIGNGITFAPDEPYKLLLTDPPYSTDVDDVAAFAESWLPNALRHVRPDGFAYVFIGAYPDELRAYLNITPPDNLSLCQVLVWTYRNTLGNNPRDRYKLNWQACLFYRGVDAPDLDCPLTSEQWAVQDINAPDGRLGNRFHTWQKPDEIAERFIRHSTRQGDTVFDPFACTGTFLLAAAKLGRRAFGFEINPDNAHIAFERGCTNGGNFQSRNEPIGA